MPAQKIILIAVLFAFGRLWAQPQVETTSSLDSLFNMDIKQTGSETKSASKYLQTTKEAASSITIITADEIARFGYETIDELLNSVRSFFITYDRMYTTVGSRGFGRLGDYNNRILLLINGHRTNENIFSSAMLGSELGIDLASVHSVEIIRGPGSTLYGSNALFAVININTKNAKSFSGIELSTSVGSYDRKQGVIQVGKSFKNDVHLYSSVITRDAKGQKLYFKEYHSAEEPGIAHNLDAEKLSSLNGNIQYKNFQIQGFWSNREKYYPTAAYSIGFNVPGAKVLDARAFGEISYNKNFSHTVGSQIKVSYDYYKFAGWYPADTDYKYFDKAIGKWFGLEGQLIWDVTADDRLSFGGEYQHNLTSDYKAWDAEETFTLVKQPYKNRALYLENEYIPWRQLKIITGARWDDYTTIGNHLSPRGALIYMPNSKTSVKGLIGTAFRVPDLYETYYSDDYANAIANPNLAIEKITTTELVLEQSLYEQVAGFISLYQYEMQDLINQSEIENPEVPDQPFLQFQNLESVKAHGYELELRGTLKKIQGYTSFNNQFIKNKATNEKLNNSPRTVFKFGLSAPVYKWGYASVNLVHESERLTLYSYSTEPFTMVNANFKSSLLFNRVTLSFKVINVFNDNYVHPAGYDHLPIETIPQNGRNYLAKINLKF
ncbi:MAG TPA: TonB-dependent receptor [bacterium]|nr:TonB-dependent receptor [bacterium]HPN44715.1 TonB-dependent receptor [bacterium]